MLCYYMTFFFGHCVLHLTLHLTLTLTLVLFEANMGARVTEMDKRLKVLKGREYVFRQRMLRDIVAKADVVCFVSPPPSFLYVFFFQCAWLMMVICLFLWQVCTTCIRSASYTLSVIDFPVVFLDEASMSTEPASLVALMKGVRYP